MLYDSNATKRAANLSVNDSLLTEAKKYKINLSQTLEKSLIKIITKKKKEAWLADNNEALQEYNHRIEKRGIFSDKIRSF